MKRILFFLLLLPVFSLGQNYFKGVNTSLLKFDYETNIGGTFGARSLIDKGYHDSVASLKIAGTIANTQVAVGNGTNSIAGSSAITFNGTYLDVMGTVVGTAADTVLKLRLSDDANSYLVVKAASSTSGRFSPVILGHTGSAASQAPLTIIAQVSDAMDTGTEALMGFDARLSSGTAVVNRDLWALRNFGSDKMLMKANGNLGIGTSLPTAVLHLKAGTATANTAPQKFTSGTELTTPEAGVLETSGTQLKYSTSTTAASRGFVQLGRYAATATSLSADANHSVIDVTATGQTITLPTAVGIQGRQYTIKLTASGTGTVDTTSSQTIDGSTTYSLSAQYKYVTVMSNDANWIIIANN